MSENTKPKTQMSRLQAIVWMLVFTVFLLTVPNLPIFQAKPGQIAEASYSELKTEKEKALESIEIKKVKLEKEAEIIKKEKELLELQEGLKVSGLETKSSPQDPVTAILVSVGIKQDDKTKLPTDNEKEWATKIDSYIAKFNPKINNQGCGSLTGQDWVNAGKKHGNHPYFLVAIARADTSLGKGLTNRCNLGNTGHCDSCKKGNRYGSFINSVNSISQTLSNQYLGKGTLSCHFSRGGWKQCPEGQNVNNGKFYASSLVNWNNNVNNTLASLFGYQSNKYNVKI